MSKATLVGLRKLDTDAIVRSLRPGAGNVEQLTVKVDGTVMQGNHRVQVLMERGYDVNKLPRVNYKSQP